MVEDRETPIVVAVPARADYLDVVRTVTASVAARMDMPYDTILDMQLAADEACAYLLALSSQGRTLTFRITPRRDGLEMIATTDADADAASWPPPRTEETLTWQILAALADEVHFERWEMGPALRLTTRRARPVQS